MEKKLRGLKTRLQLNFLDKSFLKPNASINKNEDFNLAMCIVDWLKQIFSLNRVSNTKLIHYI